MKDLKVIVALAITLVWGAVHSSPNAYAQNNNETTFQDPVGAEPTDGADATLKDNMKQMLDRFKSIKSSLDTLADANADAAKKDAAAKLATLLSGEMQTISHACILLTPSTVESITDPTDKHTQSVAYQKKMFDLFLQLGEMNFAFSQAQFDAAKKAFQQVGVIMQEGHKLFKPQNPTPHPGPQ